MLQGLLMAILAVAGFVALLCGVLVLPFLLLGLLLKLLVFLVLLPFRILGAVFGVFVGIATGVAKLLLALLVGVLGLVLLAGGALLIPLLPFLAIGFVIWLVARAARPRPVLVRSA